jgi:hypothetical protein
MGVTSNAALGYLDCKNKAYLTIHGETDTRSDYQRMIEEAQKNFVDLASARLIGDENAERQARRGT